MGELVETAKALASPATKLIEVISRGIGTLYEPHKIRKLADAEAYRIGVLTEAVSQNAPVPITYNSNGIQIDSSDYEELQKRAAQRFVHQETQRQYNIESIADKAYDFLPQDGDSSNETVSNDWISRFISSAEDVFDEDIQHIWAKILAGEIQHPRTYSLRTLETLKNLSKEEAILFSKICPYIISDEFLPNDDAYIESIGLNYSNIVLLDECGLINSSGLITKNMEIKPINSLVFKNDQLVLCASSKTEANKKLSFNVFLLSKTGQELYHAIKTNQANDEFSGYARRLVKKDKDISFSLHKIKNIQNGNIHYDPEDLLAFNDADSDL